MLICFCILFYFMKGNAKMAEKKKKSSFWSDFKAFITRGNVVDMAVGVIIGGSFGKIVNGLVTYILNPFIGLFLKTGDLDSLKTIITPEQLDEAGNVVVKEVAILWGTWLQTIIDFLITALCIFTVLRVLMKAKDILESDRIEKEEAKKKEEEEKAAAEKAEADRIAKEASDALAEKQAKLDASILKQEQLLSEILASIKSK